jgi:hypothetical protein
MGRDSAKLSTGSHRSALPAIGAGLMQRIRTVFARVRRISTMAIKNSTIFANHGVMKRSSVALWQSVLVM